MGVTEKLLNRIRVLKWENKALQSQLEEKDAMINWLVAMLQSKCMNKRICDACGLNKDSVSMNWCHNNNWRKAAQEAVKKTEG